jgi:hypothetical protein
MKNDKEKNNRRNAESNEARHRPEEDGNRLPGEYPPSEDIMNPNSDMERVHVEDLDRLSTSRKTSTELKNNQPENTDTPDVDSNESDLTQEDMQALGPRDLSMDMGDDEQLAARDLDVPSGDMDKTEALDQGDEENDHYSLGGDNHHSLEDDSMRSS